MSTQVQVALEPYVPVHSFTCQDSVNQTQLSAISLTNSNLLVPGRYILVATDTFGQRSVSFNISIAGIWRYLVSSISAQCIYIYIFFLCFFSYQIGLCIILPFTSPLPFPSHPPPPLPFPHFPLHRPAMRILYLNCIILYTSAGKLFIMFSLHGVLICQDRVTRVTVC